MTEERKNLDAVCIEILQREDGTTMPAFRDLSGKEKDVLALDLLFVSGTPSTGWFTNVVFAGRVYLVSVGIDLTLPPIGVEWPSGRPRLVWTVEGELQDPRMHGGWGYLQHVREQSPGAYALDRLLAVPTESDPDPWKNYAPRDMSKVHIAPGAHFTNGKLLPVLIIFHPAIDESGPRFTVKPFSSGLPNGSLLPRSPRRETFRWDLADLPGGMRYFRLTRTTRAGRPPVVEFDGAIQAGFTRKYSQKPIGGAVATARDGDVDNWCVRVIYRPSTVFPTLPRVSA